MGYWGLYFPITPIMEGRRTLDPHLIPPTPGRQLDGRRPVCTHLRLAANRGLLPRLPTGFIGPLFGGLERRLRTPGSRLREIGQGTTGRDGRTEAQDCLVPPLLDREATKLDALFARGREAVEPLRELRNAPISAAVTAPHDVRQPGAGA